MEPSNLIAYKLRKLVDNCNDQEQLAEGMRRLLGADRAAHMPEGEHSATSRAEPLFGSRPRLVE